MSAEWLLSARQVQGTLLHTDPGTSSFSQAPAPIGSVPAHLVVGSMEAASRFLNWATVSLQQWPSGLPVHMKQVYFPSPPMGSWWRLIPSNHLNRNLLCFAVISLCARECAMFFFWGGGGFSSPHRKACFFFFPLFFPCLKSCCAL